MGCHPSHWLSYFFPFHIWDVTITIYNDTHIYIYIYMWVNYNDLTATSLESWLGFGESSPNGPTIIQQFRLVKCYNLPIYMGCHPSHWLSYFFPFHIWDVTITIYNDTHIYIYMWVNYNDLTATSLESWLGFGESSPNGPTIIQQFRLVKCYNLPIYMGCHPSHWLSYFFPFHIWDVTITIYNDTHIYIYIHVGKL